MAPFYRCSVRPLAAAAVSGCVLLLVIGHSASHAAESLVDEASSLATTPNDLRAERITLGLNQTDCRDSCNMPTGENPNMCTCRSSQECVEMGDCCADQLLTEVRHPRRACVPAGVNRDLVAVVRCPGDWAPVLENDDTKARCEIEKRGGMKLSYLDDLPVLSRLSGVLYRNVYCASCNGDTTSLHNWELQIDCKPKEAAEVLQNGMAIDIGYSFQMRRMMIRWKAGKPKAQCSVAIKELQNKGFSQELNVTECLQKPLVMTCPEGYADSEIREKCHSYASMVEDTVKMLVYRNIHCAICNGRSAKSLSCHLKAQQGPERRVFSAAGMSYAVVMDFSNWQASALSSAPAKNLCGREEIYDPVANRCVWSGCPPDVCVQSDDCQWTRLQRDKVAVQDDGTLLPVPGSEPLNPNRWYRDDTGAVMACISKPDYEAALRPVGFEDVLSTVLLLISVLCLVLHVAAYVLVPKLRTGPSRLLLCLALSVLVAQGSFVAGGLFLASGSAFCSTCAVVSHSAHLAAFFWMNVMAMDVQRTFRKGVSGSSRAVSAFLAYSAYAWLTPAILVAAASTLQYVRPESPWSPSYGSPFCWINRPLSLVAFFGAPVLLLLLANTVFFLLTARSIHQTTKQTKVARNSVCNGGVSSSSNERSRLALYVKLAVVFGLTWVFGFAAALTGLRALWYPFIILCGLQGAFIFLAFTFKKNVFLMVKARICGTRGDRGRRPRSTLSTRTTELHSTLSSSSARSSLLRGRAPPAPTDSLKGSQKPLLRRT